MTNRSLTLYDAFSETAFGGSQAAVITDAAGIDAAMRQRIAREIGMPATAFVDALGKDWIQVQFISTVQELPMCGHGTICLLTHLVESGLMQPQHDIQLRLPKTQARVSVDTRENGRFQVMLDIEPPVFTPAPPRIGEILGLLGLDLDALAPRHPVETARGDFVHLVVPLAGLDAMRAIRPDFSGIVGYCHAQGLETIAVFCLDTQDASKQLHVRDFCPAVGVSESAAAGTTNAALTSYLVRHRLAPPGNDISVNAEQGLELGRPSSIHSRVAVEDGRITRLQVGGVATRVFHGEIHLQEYADAR